MNWMLRQAPIVIFSFVLTVLPAAAQSDFPNKPVRMVHGFTAGGISDVLARSIGAKLSASLGQPVVVDPRSGAGTTIASDHVAKSAGDGYTCSCRTSPAAINASSTGGCHRSVRDFTPITLIAATPMMLIVHPRCREVGKD